MDPNFSVFGVVAACIGNGTAVVFVVQNRTSLLGREHVRACTTQEPVWGMMV